MSSQTVGPRIVENYDFIKRVCKTRSVKKCSGLVENATEEELLSLVEVALNVLKYRFKLRPAQQRKMQPMADLIRQLSRARTPYRVRRIVQIGGAGFLPALLAPIILEVGRYLLTRDANGA